MMDRHDDDQEVAVLGRTYRDTITGYMGVATSRTTYLYGCVRVCLERADKDGKPEFEHFDEQRLTAVRPVNAAPVVHSGLEPQPATSGGPHPAPRRAPDSPR